MVAYADAALTRPPSSEEGTDESLTSPMASLSVVSKTKKSDYPLAAGDPDSGGFDLLVKARNAPAFVPRAMRQPTPHQIHMQQQQAYANSRVHPRQQYRSTQFSPSHPSSRDGDVETASTASPSDSGTEVAKSSQQPPPAKPSVQHQSRPGYVSPVPQHEKPTAAQLEEKMARMRQINADVAAKRLAQESDAKAYEDSIAADRAALEEKERRLAIAMATMEAARRDAAERKLANMQGRVWDAEKEAPLPNKNEPEPAPASFEPTPVAAALAEARTFERAAPPHLPHLPSPRLQDRRAVFYAPGPVPTADVVTRSDLIGWGTPPASPPAPDEAQSLSDPTSAHIPYGAQQSLHPQLEEAYPPTVPQVQQNAWNGAPSAGDGAPQDGGPTQLADSSKAGAPQQASSPAQGPTPAESQYYTRSTAKRLPERNYGAPPSMEGKQPYDFAPVPPASVVASVFANEAAGGWGVFDPMAPCKSNATATAQQNSYMCPPQTLPPQPKQNRPSITPINRGIESSRWAPKAAMDGLGRDESSFDKSTCWRRDPRPSALLTVREVDDTAWEVIDKNTGDRPSKVQGGHFGGDDNDRYPAARANPLSAPASPTAPNASASDADRGWGGSFHQAERSPPGKSSSGGLGTDSAPTGPHAPAPGALQGGWGDHRQPTVEDPSLRPTLSPNSQEGNRWVQATFSSALPATVQSDEWHAHPQRIPEPQQSSDWSQGAHSASPHGAQTDRVLSSMISTQPPDLRATPRPEAGPGRTTGGWNSPPIVQQAAPQTDSDGWDVYQNGQQQAPYQQPQPYSQPQQQRQQPPAAPMPARPAAPIIYVHPDRLAAVPTSAASPPVQEFGYAGKGFGFGGGKNLRIERDDTYFHRHGFANGVNSSVGGGYDIPPNAGGGANAIPIAGRPRWGNGKANGASTSPAPPYTEPYASRPSVVEERPSYVQEQAALQGGGWGVAKDGGGQQDFNAW